MSDALTDIACSRMRSTKATTGDVSASWRLASRSRASRDSSVSSSSAASRTPSALNPPRKDETSSSTDVSWALGSSAVSIGLSGWGVSDGGGVNAVDALGLVSVASDRTLRRSSSSATSRCTVRPVSGRAWIRACHSGSPQLLGTAMSSRSASTRSGITFSLCQWAAAISGTASSSCKAARSWSGLGIGCWSRSSSSRRFWAGSWVSGIGRARVIAGLQAGGGAGFRSLWEVCVALQHV